MKKNSIHLFLIFLVLALSLSACAKSEETNIEVVEELADSAAESEEIAKCSALTEENALFIFDDIEHMTLLTSPDGGGPRPQLAWESVQGADYYLAVLYAEDGRPYWSWLGEDNEIYVGGLSEEPPPPEIAVGPIVMDCMTWMTTAYSADGVPIAAGGPRLISP